MDFIKINRNYENQITFDIEARSTEFKSFNIKEDNSIKIEYEELEKSAFDKEQIFNKSFQISKIPTEIYDIDMIEINNHFLLFVPNKTSVSIIKFDTILNEFIFVKEIENLTSEFFYCIKSMNFGQDRIMVGMGSTSGDILILNLVTKEFSELQSNCGSVFDLKFFPKNSDFEHFGLIAAAYKNGLISIWNWQTNKQIIHLNPVTPFPDCKSIDIHHSGKLIVAGYIDGCVSIWQLNEKDILRLNSSTQTSPRQKKREKTIMKMEPIFQTFDAHNDYLENVFFFGNQILSKDRKNKIILWNPFFPKSSYLKCREYRLPADAKEIWFTQMTLNLNNQSMMIPYFDGNANFVFEINLKVDDSNVERFRIEQNLHLNMNESYIIRKCLSSEDNKYLFCISDDGHLRATVRC